jgi:hypothetical protein
VFVSILTVHYVVLFRPTSLSWNQK